MVAQSSVTSYRVYCQADGCDAQTVLREDAIDASEWTVTSLHFHEGYCPAHGRGREVVQMLADEGVRVSALDTTKEGHPVHPLYQPADAKPGPFAYGEEVRSGGGD